MRDFVVDEHGERTLGDTSIPVTVDEHIETGQGAGRPERSAKMDDVEFFKTVRDTEMLRRKTGAFIERQTMDPDRTMVNPPTPISLGGE